MALAAVILTASGGLGVISRSLVSTAGQVTSSRQPHEQSANYLRPRALVTTLQGAYLAQDAGELARLMATPAPTPEPTAEPRLAPTPEPTPAYFTYTVQPGDTIAGIAAAFGIDFDYIFWNNPDVRDDPDLLIVGQEILIPSVNGLIYRVKLGDTLSDIAAFYDIDVQSIIDFSSNGLTAADSIIEDLVLVLPGAVPPPPAPPPAPPPVVAAAEPAPASEPTQESPPPVTSSGYIWPFVGSISSYFGEPRGGGAYHEGIDIEGFGRYGEPVVVAASGQVVLVSWQSSGLGYHVIIRHDDGSETVYAHLSDIYVGQGQFVGQGETVGAIGCTGYCTGPHLHFEVRIGGVPVDPLGYLP